MKIIVPCFHWLLLAACSASHNQVAVSQPTLPACIRQKIEAIKQAPRQNPPQSITEFTYKGNKVYYITAPCCDQFSEVYDSECSLLGHPDGGFTGKGDGKLPGFAQEATGEKLIWKDDRK